MSLPLPGMIAVCVGASVLVTLVAISTHCLMLMIPAMLLAVIALFSLAFRC